MPNVWPVELFYKIMLQLFGHKSVALFDIWTIEHFFSGANLGVFFLLMRSRFNLGDDPRTKLMLEFFFVLALELFWEITEHYFEAGTLIPSFQYWFQGVECYANRAISDPIITMAGFFFIKKFAQFRIFSSVFSAIWLFFHVVIFPHSMYLQDKIVNYFT